MPRTVADAEKEAAEVLAKLESTLTAPLVEDPAVDPIAKLTVDHAEEFKEARASAKDKEKDAKDNTDAADGEDNSSKAKNKDGEDAAAKAHRETADQHRLTAAVHRELADGFHELTVHHLEKSLTSVDPDAVAKDATELGTEHAAAAHTLETAARVCDNKAGIAKAEKKTDRSGHFEEVAKGLHKSAQRRAALAKRCAELVSESKKIVAKRVEEAANANKPKFTVLVKSSLNLTEEGIDRDRAVFFGKRDLTDEQRQKLADTGRAMSDGSFPIETKKDLEHALAACDKADDKIAVKTFIIGRAKALGSSNLLPDEWLGDKKAMAKEVEERRAKKLAAVGGLGKGLYVIAELAQLLERVKYLQQNAAVEQLMEHDSDSELPGKFDAWLSSGAELLEAVVAEECEELMEGDDIEAAVKIADGEVLDSVAKALTWPMSIVAALRDVAKTIAKGADGRRARFKTLAETFEKYGARNSKADMAKLQSIHDHTTSMGAKCEDSKESVDKLASITSERDTAITVLDRFMRGVGKVQQDVQAQRKENATVKKQVEILISDNDSLKKRLQTVERQPQASRVRGVTTIAKSQDGGGTDLTAGGGSTLLERIEAIPAGQERAAALAEIGYMPRRQ